MLNAADRRSVRAAEKAGVRAERERGEFVKHIMSSATGRHFVWDLLADAGVFLAILPTDALQMAFLEGQRNGGLKLLAIVMQYAPDLYIQAQREANERRTLSDTPDRTAGQRSDPEDPGRDDQGRGDDGDEGTGDYYNGAPEERRT